jgi:endoglucanase
MKRKQFLKDIAISGLAVAVLPTFANAADGLIHTTAKALSSNWRGFNLLERFSYSAVQPISPFLESDLALIASLGFNFIRIPCSYLFWMKQEDWFGKEKPQITNEAAIVDIDKLIVMAKKYNLHVNLNMHRIQGYCVNSPAEPANLWQDEKALNAAVWQWQFFAERYKDIDSTHLSFDLINEPSNVDEASYTKVINAIVAGIRAIDANRVIVVDGLNFGTVPLMHLHDKSIIQSTRGYNPMYVSHYKASWVNGSDTYPLPKWPITVNNKLWNKATLRKDYIQPWKLAEASGVAVHVGEWGCYNQTPHKVALKWMEDCLALWKQAGWGWAL